MDEIRGIVIFGVDDANRAILVNYLCESCAANLYDCDDTKCVNFTTPDFVNSNPGSPSPCVSPCTNSGEGFYMGSC